jgi:hypothetical protein
VSELELMERETPAFLRHAWEEARTEGAAYEARVDALTYSVLIGREPVHLPNNPPDLRWHISVAGKNYLPTWAHLTQIVHRLRPGVTFCVGIPPKSHWINLHKFTLHAWEIHDDNLTGSWRDQRRGDTPT